MAAAWPESVLRSVARQRVKMQAGKGERRESVEHYTIYYTFFPRIGPKSYKTPPLTKKESLT